MFLRIQELLSDDTTDCGRIPRTLECELLDDLVDTISPGENVTVSGTLHVLDSEESKSLNFIFIELIELFLGSSKGSASYSLTMSVNSIKGSKKANNHSEDSLFSVQDRETIQRISGNKNLFKLLVDSLCPEIIGHEIIKAGLVLG